MIFVPNIIKKLITYNKKLLFISIICFSGIIILFEKYNYMFFNNSINQNGIILKQITANINALHLAEQVTIAMDNSNHKIYIKGVLNISEMKGFYNNISILKHRFANKYAFVTEIKDVESELPFQINEIYIGYPSYIVVNENNKLMVGSSYLNVTVESISSRVAIFKNKNTTITLIFNNDTESAIQSFTNESEIPKVNIKQRIDNNNILEVSPSRTEVLKYEKEKMEKNVVEDNTQKVYLQQLLLVAGAKLKTIIANQIEQVNQDMLVNQHELRILEGYNE